MRTIPVNTTGPINDLADGWFLFQYTTTALIFRKRGISFFLLLKTIIVQATCCLFTCVVTLINTFECVLKIKQFWTVYISLISFKQHTTSRPRNLDVKRSSLECNQRYGVIYLHTQAPHSLANMLTNEWCPLISMHFCKLTTITR